LVWDLQINKRAVPVDVEINKRAIVVQLAPLLIFENQSINWVLTTSLKLKENMHLESSKQNYYIYFFLSNNKSNLHPHWPANLHGIAGRRTWKHTFSFKIKTQPGRMAQTPRGYGRLRVQKSALLVFNMLNRRANISIRGPFLFGLLP